jgi:pimeloyl-ACP methyl ester carboxylesterase
MKLVHTLIAILISAGFGRAQQHLLIEKTGHGPAVFFIPGLYSSGDVWKETVAHLSDRYTCYSLTLPGFAGQPPLPASGAILDSCAAEIAAYIRHERITHPILVGHSLGGWLALRIESSYPGLCGGLVTVSSAPFLPALSMGDGISADSARAIGAQIKHYMSIQNPQQAAASSKASISFMIRDTARVAEVCAMAARSDVPTQAEAMYELFGTDLRPAMARVRCPVLVLGDWFAYKGYGATRENTIGKYQHQFALAPHVTIEVNDSSRHFIMYDEPEWFYGQVDRFLSVVTAK